MTMGNLCKVLMLLEDDPYPFDSRVRLEALTLLDAGYGVTVICPNSKGQRVVEIVEGVRVYRFPSVPEVRGALGYALEWGYSTLMIAILSLWILFRHGFDIVHLNNPPDCLILAVVGYKLLGKKIVFDHHDLVPEAYLSKYGGRKNWLYRVLLWLEQMSQRIADVVIVTNDSYRYNAIERVGKPASRVFVVRNGPRLSFGQRQGNSHAPVPTKDRLGSEMCAYALGYLGIMSVSDGVDYLLRSIYHLVYEMGRVDLQCLIIGDGSALPSLRQLAKDLNIENHVRFIGRLKYEQIPEILATVTVCVEPAPASPFNDKSTMIKVVEYMALSKPIVAFDLLETRYTAQEAALYARPNDERDFAEKIAMLLDNADLQAQMAAHGRRRFQQVLAWEHSVPSLLQAYNALFSGGPL